MNIIIFITAIILIHYSWKFGYENGFKAGKLEQKLKEMVKVYEVWPPHYVRQKTKQNKIIELLKN